MTLGTAVSGATPLDTHRFPSAARVIASLLNEIKFGSLMVHWPDGQTSQHGHAHPIAHIRLNDFDACSATLRRGDIGFAESFMDGHWSTDNLAQLLTLFVANRNRIQKVLYGSPIARFVYNLRHWFNRNTVTQARKNIAAHYDLGNDFYRLWLDPSMTYSSALYASPARDDTLSLERAQDMKYTRILDEARIGPHSRVLEIGCGWGGFAEAAARRGAHVKGLTLSTEQLAYAEQRLADADLSHLTHLALQDYRHEHDQYDAIASIEMFEAVGQEYWATYFETVRNCLKPGGRAVVQTITIAEDLFEQYRKTPDFIQTYIFPGGMLPSPSAFARQAQKAGLKVVGTLSFGHDYARTLAVWRETFMVRLDAIRAQGFDDEFIKMWEFYLAYCEAAFAGDNTDVMHFTLEHGR